MKYEKINLLENLRTKKKDLETDQVFVALTYLDCLWFLMNSWNGLSCVLCQLQTCCFDSHETHGMLDKPNFENKKKSGTKIRNHKIVEV